MTNLTPHSITVRLPDREFIYPVFGLVARAGAAEAAAGDVEGVPCVRRTLGAVEWPTGTPETGYLIVSSLVLEAAKGAGDPRLPRLLAPDTGPTAVREGGQVVAVTRWVVA